MQFYTSDVLWCEHREQNCEQTGTCIVEEPNAAAPVERCREASAQPDSWGFPAEAEDARWAATLTHVLHDVPAPACTLEFVLSRVLARQCLTPAYMQVHLRA